ncbi:hypothetical protein Dsin_021184 [Dipteronia sinensis]|uniref:Small ribosomal subunit protein uS5c n=1 Tax=Dipteronia sinensis TaxID=43782 RepID=A0AAE0ABV1_9ROSI|nr:hypothetical protein Dsin_021184 [Dipteronia sinensis]
MATATATTATPLSSFSSLSISLHTTPRLSFLSTTANQKPITRLLPKLALSSLICRASSSSDKPPTEIDTSFFDNFNPNADEDVVFDPPTPPEDYVSPPSFDDLPEEDDEEIAAAFEELYGPAYSGISVLGKDINVMDSKVKKTGALGKTKKEKIKDGFDERVVQVRRVTKVVKGGKQLRFRAIVVVGDKKGQVGVGVGKAKEVIAAVQKSAVNARRNIITVPMTKYLTFPHRSDGDYGAAKVMLRPASPGTGVIAGGAVRIVLEMAGVENALGKQIGSNNALNNARATVVAVQKMRQFRDVARDRGIPMEELWK